MLKKALSSDSIYVASDFFTDGVDFLDRFDRCFELYFGLKSRRLKCFIDLRMACESFLKSLVALNGDQDLDRKVVIKHVESFRHNIPKLAAAASYCLSDDILSALQPYSKRMAELPIGLRYTLDGYDFIEAQHEIYYETIGDDKWMDSFFAVLCNLKEEIGNELAKHSGIIDIGDIPIEKILDPEFNKYSK